MPNEQTVHLERYAPNVKTAFSRAQALADSRKQAIVTIAHLVHVMLEQGCGRDPCLRAGVDPEALASEAAAAIAAVPAGAKTLSYLDTHVLAAMAHAERLA